MKRHQALEPFSRDHNDGLILARRLAEGAEALPTLREAWERELSDHFAEEERLLLPLCDAEARARMEQEHGEIAALIDSATGDEDARRLGTLLHDHIRWEERELFPDIEASATEATLRSLARAAASLERRRGEANALRRELVARRPAVPTEPALVDLGFLAGVTLSSGPQWGLETEDLNATLLTWSRGEGIAVHVNEEVDVLVVVLAGEVAVEMEGERYVLREGHAIAIPKGSSRSLTALSERAAHLNVHKRRRKLMPT